MERGEVWWFESPSTTRRPCIVMTRSAAIPVLNRVVVVPITTRRRGIPTEVALDADDGLPRPCVATTDNVEVVPKSMLTERLGELSAGRMSEVCHAIAVSVGCR